MAHICSFRQRLLAAVLSALSLLPLLGRPGAAHDIPDEIIVRSFVKPEGDRLAFLIRVPLALLEGLALPKRGPGYLDLARIDDALERSALAVARGFVLYEDGSRLTHERARTRISQPSEDSFGTFAEARAHIQGPPLPDESNVFWNQGYLDVGLAYPIRSDRSSFALEVLAGSGLSGRLKLFVQFLPPDGAPRIYQIHGGHGWLELDPSWHHAAWTFVKLGFGHILEGIDHLLFLLCLVLPFRLRHLWSLAGVITAFTVGHSLTLIAAATGAVPAGNWFPPLVETLIAVSIVYMALENVWTAWGGHDAARRLRLRWLITGCFGLIHGFGFAFVLTQELQFAGEHLLASLLAFNVGVELGQIAVLLVTLPVLEVALRRPAPRRLGVIILSALICHTAWHWMVERLEVLWLIPWPEPDWSLLRLPVASLLIALGLTLLVLARRRRRPAAAHGDD